MRTHIIGFALVAVLLSPLSSAAADTDQDRQAAQRVANNMKQSGLLKDYRVGVKYADGVAWLTGSVISAEQKAAAEQIARRSAGVERVVSQLEIDASQQSNTRRTMTDASVQRASRVATQRTVRGQRMPQNRLPQTTFPQTTSPQNNTPRPYARMGGQMGGQGVQPANYGGPAMGARPMPAGGGQAVSYDNPQMPGYAWPSYAASPNYAALSYPKQYSPSAWPYIGPFYPYPQVPLGWRKVTLEWDDGWWFLDFKDNRN